MNVRIVSITFLDSKTTKLIIFCENILIRLYVLVKIILNLFSKKIQNNERFINKRLMVILKLVATILNSNADVKVTQSCVLHVV